MMLRRINVPSAEQDRKYRHHQRDDQRCIATGTEGLCGAGGNRVVTHCHGFEL